METECDPSFDARDDTLEADGAPSWSSLAHFFRFLLIARCSLLIAFFIIASPMTFPSHIAEILDRFGVAPDTKEALYDLYISLGSGVLERFADLSDEIGPASQIRPEDLSEMRREVTGRYLTENHSLWAAGQPTPSLWHPRSVEGRASGIATPLGSMDGQGTPFSISVAQLIKEVLPAGQTAPKGLLLLGRNAHYGGRPDTITFDVVADRLEDALEIAAAQGQQHTIPGSVGATSGTIDARAGLALLWEVQPNVLKPAGERNRSIGSIYRKHRNWHVATMTAAVAWLRRHDITAYVIRGEALSATHEVNAAKPVSANIIALHNRTVLQVVQGLGATLRSPDEQEALSIIDSGLMNTGLRAHVESQGVATAIWRIAYGS